MQAGSLHYKGATNAGGMVTETAGIVTLMVRDGAVLASRGGSVRIRNTCLFQKKI